jgi:CRISPR-associated protein Csd1
VTILQSLALYYDRLEDVAAPGWSMEKFGWCIVLDPDGAVVDVENLHDVSGKKPQIRLYKVPASFPRPGTTPRSFLLWDKTAFALGVTKSNSGGRWDRSERQHAAFAALHLARLAGQEDAGLIALRRFIDAWRPEHFDAPPFRPEMLDANIMFRLEGERRYLHERPAARALIGAQGVAEADDGGGVFCLVTGERGRIARLHPTIKGVEGAQSSGAALVSFNLDAFTSLGQEQGENAPTSEGAAFRYGTALNHMLGRASGNRLRRPIGDATVIFWADASEARAAEAADDFFSQLMDGDVTDADEAAQIRTQLKKIADGRPVAELHPEIEPGTRFHILGLSPNAARLSVRFWLTGTLDQFARRLAEHHADLRIEPEPYGWGAAPSVRRLLVNSVALLRDAKNVPPQLAGDVMRAVLTGSRYPQSLLAAVLIRLRAGDNIGSGWHVALIRAVLTRDQRLGFYTSDPFTKGSVPMSLKRDHDNPGYQLGRLFAVYELAQRAALKRVNATIRDRYFGAASATPASVFPLIVRGGQNHLSKVRKEKPGWAALIERELEEIHGRIEPSLPRSLPRSLSLQNQGEFAIGYYHQRAARLSNDKGEELPPLDVADDIEGEEA